MKMKIPAVHLSLTDLKNNQPVPADIFCDIMSPEFCEIHFQVSLYSLSMTYLQVGYHSLSTDRLSFMVKQQLVRSNQTKVIAYKASQETL